LPRGSVEGLARSARAAGLEIVSESGFFNVEAPELGFRVHASTLTAARERAAKAGIASDRIDELARELAAAADGGYEWVSSPFFLELTLRKPTAA
jgi:hypothetical protein